MQSDWAINRKKWFPIAEEIFKAHGLTRYVSGENMGNETKDPSLYSAMDMLFQIAQNRENPHETLRQNAKQLAALGRERVFGVRADRLLERILRILGEEAFRLAEEPLVTIPMDGLRYIVAIYHQMHHTCVAEEVKPVIQSAQYRSAYRQPAKESIAVDTMNLDSAQVANYWLMKMATATVEEQKSIAQEVRKLAEMKGWWNASPKAPQQARSLIEKAVKLLS